MYHHYDVALNSKGGPTADVIIRAFNVADDSIADLFSDESGTPIESVSGIANAAKSNAEGNYDFFIADGFYNLRFYIGDALVQTIRNVQFKNAASADELTALETQIADINTTVSDGNVTLMAPENGTGWWSGDTQPPKVIENPSRTFFGLEASEADGQFTGTNWVSANFNHYLIRSNTATILSKTGGTAMFGATRNGDRYRQPALATALTPWSGGEAITAGQQRGRIGKRYVAATSGTCGSNPPTHSSGTVSDGGVNWTYIDNRGQYFTPIATSALAWSEVDDGEGTWAGYIDLTRGPSGGLSFGVEYAVKNLGTNVTADPYNVLPAGGTIGAWFAGGGDPSYGGAPANPSTVAQLVGKNGSTWNSGIIFGHDALADVGGRKQAISMAANGQAIQWFRGAGLPSFEIRSDDGFVGRDLRMVSNGYATEFRAVRPNGAEDVLFGIEQPDMSAPNSRTNQFYFQSSISTTGAAGNGWVKTQSAGFDNNIDYQQVTKGSGVNEFGKNSVFGEFGGSPNYVGSKSDSTIVAVEGSEGNPVGTSGAVGYFQKYSNALSYNTLAGIATKTRNATNARATGIFGEATDVSGGATTFVEGGRFQGVLSSGDSGSAYGIIGAAGTNASGPTNIAYLIGVEGEVTKQVGSDAPTYGSFNIDSFSAAFVASCGVGVGTAKKADAALFVNSYGASKFRTALLISSAVDDSAIAALAGTGLSSGIDLHLATISYASFWSPNNAPIRFSNAANTVGLNMLNLNATNDFVVGQDLAGSLLIPSLPAHNYVDDAAAAAAGIKVGGLYHSSGTVKVRLS